MEFKISKNPYDERNMFKNTTLEIQEGDIYCFVGCNGSGKTTLMRCITEELEKQNAYQIRSSYLDFRGIFGEKKYSDTLAYYTFDKETHEYSSEDDIYFSQFKVAFSSTGEGVIQKLGSGVQLLAKFIHNKENQDKSLWIIFDDCDAGTSIDMINDIQKVIELIQNDCKKFGITLTVVLSANSYEMCKKYNCINVWDFSPITFNSYEEYKTFVLDSRKRKEKQIEKRAKTKEDLL